MTDIIDFDQIQTVGLSAPSTSRTSALKPASSATSTRDSTPTPAPRSCPPPPRPRRVTRSRAAATASASGSRVQSDVPTARHPLHHARNTTIKRDPTSSLTPPPPDDAAEGSSLNPNIGDNQKNARSNSESVQTDERDSGNRRSPSLALGESSTGSFHDGPTGDVSRLIAQSDTGLVEHSILAATASASRSTAAGRATTPVANGRPATSSTSRARSPPSNPQPKRKRSDSDDKGPLLSEYMCPICFSPPKSAVITPCGHILCGACLHGATTARAAAAQPLCPVCRTPIPGLRFAKPEPLPGHGVTPGSQGSNSGRTGSRRPRKRHVPPASRTLPNGVSFPTPAEDMIDQDRAEIVSEGGTIDVDNEEVDEEIEDAARSGVIGLEPLTMASL